jgi:protein transport protein SEC24
VQTGLITHVTASFVDAATDMLAAYRRYCAANSSAGQLILPESLKLLPLYLAAATKLSAFVVNRPLGRPASGRSPFSEALVRADARAAALVALGSLPTHRMVPTIYPRVFRVDSLPEAVGVPPPCTPMVSPTAEGESPLSLDALLAVPLPPHTFPSAAPIASTGVYVIDAHAMTLILVGADVAPDELEELLGAPSVDALPPAELRALGPHSSRRLRNIVGSLRARRAGAAIPLRVVGPDDAAGRAAALELLVEDQTPASGSGSRSYVDLLCAVHSAIQQRAAL